MAFDPAFIPDRDDLAGEYWEGRAIHVTTRPTRTMDPDIPVDDPRRPDFMTGENRGRSLYRTGD